MHQPIIGVSSNFKPHEGENGTFHLDKSYTDMVSKNGGIPQILPLLPVEEIPTILPLYDGILLSGGGGLLPQVEQMDVLPGLREQNPNRYNFECAVITYALKKDIPLLGICRGYQMINEVMGGSLVNLPGKAHIQEESGAQPSHKIFVEPETILSHAVQSEEVEVNSFHSQAIDKVGRGLKITSYSKDTVVESIEGTSSHFIMGLQFHPEFMVESEKMCNIYRRFIRAAAEFKDRGMEHA
ncbi:gamma-glutamyl-gamma-aminobutyrate hydrolase family protein [Virgibacillus kimchii]